MQRWTIKWGWTGGYAKEYNDGRRGEKGKERGKIKHWESAKSWNVDSLRRELLSRPEQREVRGQGAAALQTAEFTYIDLTENYVYYAANHNQGVENIPGIPKIALSEGQRAVGRRSKIF